MHSADAFYEGRYANEVRWGLDRARSPLGRVITPFINLGYYSAILAEVQPGATLLELGCAGGSALLAELGTVVGLDLSAEGLMTAARKYAHAVQASILDVEFRPESFDAVVSSFVWEHLPLETKDRVLARIAGWLKPGGRVVFLFDVMSQSPLYSWLRRRPELFRKSFIDRDGHVGLEPPKAALQRFRSAGLEVIRVAGVGRTLPHLPLLEWLEPYGKGSLPARAAAAIPAMLKRVPRLPQIYDFAVQGWDLGPGRLAPFDWSRILLVVAARTRTASGGGG